MAVMTLVLTRFTNAVEALQYMLGGRAYITLASNKTNRHYSYKITISKSNAKKYFVWVYTSSGWRFVCTLTNGGQRILRTKNGIPQDWLMYKAFVWAWGNIFNKRMPPYLVVYHNNKCCRCGKKLLDPKSIKRGIGPECLKQSA